MPKQNHDFDATATAAKDEFHNQGGRCARNWAQSDPPFRYLPEHRRAEFIAHSDSHLDMIPVIVCSSLTIEQSVE